MTHSRIQLPGLKNTIKIIIIIFFYGSLHLSAQQDSTKYRDISGPASVDKQLIYDDVKSTKTALWYALDSLDQIKERYYKKTGFILNMDYNSQVMEATNPIGNSTGASGVFRMYGKWNFIGKGTKNEGGLIYKVEHRHKYTDNALREFGPLDVGYAGFLQSVYNNQGWRVTNLYWRQSFNEEKVVAYFGFVDITDWTDVWALASPWTGFNNLVFASGSGTLGGGLPDGSFGAMVSVWANDNIYLVGSLVDTNGDATEFWKGFDSFFTEFETVKTLEIGYTPSPDEVFLRNAHISVWQADERTNAGTPNGWGVIGSVSWLIGEKYFPFIRGGWAKDGGSFYEASVSLGVGYNIAGPNTLGVGFNWNKPMESTFGAPLDNQYGTEIYYKWQLTHHFELTPNFQFVGNPAFNPDKNSSLVFGLRGRIGI